MADEAGRIEFTKEMRKTYKLLFPNMAEIHFRILQNTFRSYGYNVELLTNDGQEVVDEGLKYVHNDICYPALLTIGQMMDALHSGKYDLHKTALIITQTGGGCRASNYIHLLRKALEKDGLSYIPVISLNMSGLEKNSGFKLTLPMIRKALGVLAYGDLLMLLRNQTRPYEKNPGETDALVDKWVDDICARFLKGKGFQKKQIRTLTREIVASFDRIEILPVKKIRVGIVGEIYAKYSPLANNHLEDFLRSQDCEVNVPGIMAFMLFKVDNRLEDIKLYGGNPLKKFVIQILYDYLEVFECYTLDAVSISARYHKPASYRAIKQMVRPLIGYGCKMGEGWLLTGEMIELVETGYENIVCAQPFGCLPNHIVGKGKIRQIREMYPQANIVPIDYDPGATRVNQENRIKLMLSVARERLNEQK